MRAGRGLSQAGVDPEAAQLTAILTPEHLMAQLAGSLGALAAILAGLGLYGVTAHAISRRRVEIALRMALGAVPKPLITLVLGRALLPVCSGIVAGTAVSAWASRSVGGLIYDVSPDDPTTLAGAAPLLCTIGAVAAWLPARPAARVAPVLVLRDN